MRLADDEQVLDADTLLNRAASSDKNRPKIQPFGHLVLMPSL
jgi:hypothetical protein